MSTSSDSSETPGVLDELSRSTGVTQPLPPPNGDGDDNQSASTDASTTTAESGTDNDATTADDDIDPTTHDNDNDDAPDDATYHTAIADDADNANNDGDVADDEEESDADDDESVQELTQETKEQIMERRYGKRQSHHNLRPRKRARYLLAQHETIVQQVAKKDTDIWNKFQPKSIRRFHKLREVHKGNQKALMMATLQHIVMTQYPVEKGLKVFGQKGADAVKLEMIQLDELGVAEPRMRNMLTPEERAAALPYLMFLKEKRCGCIEGCGCADGRRQRLYKTKEETSSPTVMTESVFLTSMIDADED